MGNSKETNVASKGITENYSIAIPTIDPIKGVQTITTSDVEIIDLRAKYQSLVMEKEKNSGDAPDTYNAGYCAGHRDGQIELLQLILGIYDN
jgi:hypothetical protein